MLIYSFTPEEARSFLSTRNDDIDTIIEAALALSEDDKKKLMRKEPPFDWLKEQPNPIFTKIIYSYNENDFLPPLKDIYQFLNVYDPSDNFLVVSLLLQRQKKGES